MPGIAQGFLEALSDSAFKCLGQRRGAARRVERPQRCEPREVKVLGLSEWIDGGQFAFAKDTRRFHVLVDEAFDRENELVVKWGRGPLRQTADVEPQRVGATSEPTDEFAAEDRRHPWRKSAIGCESHATGLSPLRKRQLLAHHGIVAA